MHAGITAITELAVKSGLTNRLPPDNAKQSFFLALSPLPKRRQFDQGEIDEVVDRLLEIGSDPERFKAFVNAAEARKDEARASSPALRIVMNSELSSLKAAATPLTLNRSDGPRWTPATVRKALGKA